MLALLAEPGAARAQFNTRGASSTSTAGGGPAYVQSVEALFLNPANLGLSRHSGNVAVSLGNGTIYSGGDLLQFDFYNEHLTDGGLVTDSMAQEALDEMFGGADVMRSGGAQADLAPLVATYHTPRWGLGVGLRTRAYSRLDMNRGVLSLALRGINENRSMPVDGGVQIIVTTEVSVGGSYRLMDGRLAVGVAPKLVLGTDYTEAMLDSRVRIEDGVLTHRYDYVAKAAGSLSRDLISRLNLIDRNPFGSGNPLKTAGFGSPFAGVSGIGFGLGLGATYTLTPDVRVAASFTDIGSISWSGDTEVVTSNDSAFVFDGFELDRSRIVNEFDGSFVDYFEHVADSLATNSYGDVRREERSFSTPLPAALHLGASWQPTGAPGLTVNGGASLALNNATANLTRMPSLHTGAEYVLGGRWTVPLRVGLRVAGGGAFTLGFGTGLYAPHVNLNTGFSITPKSTFLGRGGRYAFAFSALTIRF
jgi:hypothetical protein